MTNSTDDVDVVMLGTFSTWNLGTLQARALPLAQALQSNGVRVAIVTTPWDAPGEAGVIDVIGNVPIINTRSVSVSQPWRAVLQQAAWVRRLNPTLLHVFKPKGFGGLSARLLQREYPVVVDSDDWEGDGGWNDAAGYSWPQKRVFQYQEQHLLARATLVTAASTLLAERARRVRQLSPDGVHIIENGLTAARLSRLREARTMLPSTIEKPTVVLYSRFAEFGSDWLPRFCRCLANEYPSVLDMRVIGRDRNRVDDYLGEPLLGIDLLGYVAYNSVPNLLGSSSIAIYPYQDSLITRSKQSVKLLELMAAGCPVVASDVGDVARTLGEGGRILPSSNPDDFAHEVARMLSKPGLLDSMSRSGMDRAAAHYDIASIAARLQAVYQQAGLT